MAWEPNRTLRQERAPATSFVSVRCAFCKGSGRDPGFKIASKCVACGGRGKVLIGEPYETCPECEGEGRHPGTATHCGTCRGKGVVPERPSARRR